MGAVCAFFVHASVGRLARAYDLPSLNLGGTSFFDGAVPPTGPGLYGLQFLTFHNAERFNDANGHKLPLPNQDVRLTAETTQFIFVAPVKLLGIAHPGVTVLIPVLARAAVDDGLNGAVLRSTTGRADMDFGAFLAFDPILGSDGLLLAQSVELDIFAPTGHYSRTAAISPGSNFLSLDPFYAATLWVTPQWTVSGRLHYLWNATNEAPKAALGPGAMTSQAGQAFHMNLATHYQLDPGWGIGINGYFLEQLTDTRINGAPVPGRRERVFAVGPGATYNIDKDCTVFLNAYREFGAENRIEGSRVVLRLNAHF